MPAQADLDAMDAAWEALISARIGLIDATHRYRAATRSDSHVKAAAAGRRLRAADKAHRLALKSYARTWGHA